MPVEDDSDDVYGKPNGQPQVQPPPQSSTNQYVPTATTASTAQQNEPIAIKLEKDIKAGEGWLIGIGIATLLINSFIAFIYWNQLREMHDATVAATHASETAKDTLSTMQANSVTSDAQFSTQLQKLDDSIAQSKILAAAATNQAAATNKAANAAVSAAETAKDTLHTSERAYLMLGEPQFDFSSESVRFQLINNGHIPSGKAAITSHEVTLFVPDITKRPSTNVEGHWRITRIGAVPAGTTLIVRAFIPKASESLVNVGSQFVIVAGDIIYNDGFPDTPERTWEFCYMSRVDPKSKKLDWAPCNPAELIPRIMAYEKYPQNELKDEEE